MLGHPPNHHRVSWRSVVLVMLPIVALSLLGQPVVTRQLAPNTTSGTHSIGVSYTVHAPITISNASELETFAGITGNGTVGAPFVIEGLMIDGTSTACISVSNTHVPLVIKRCLLYSPSMGTTGVMLSNCSNVSIADNSISSLTQGIVATSSSWNNIRNNSITVISNGIIFTDSHNNTVEKNKMSCSIVCMRLQRTSDTIIQDNDMTMPISGFAAIHVVESPAIKNRIVNNYIHDVVSDAILLQWVNTTTVSGNSIIKCGFGIHLIGSSGNVIEKNAIQNYSISGIYFDTGPHLNNKITWNTIEHGETAGMPAIMLNGAISTTVSCNLVRSVMYGFHAQPDTSWTVVSGNVFVNVTNVFCIMGKNQDIHDNDFTSFTTLFYFPAAGESISFSANYYSDYTAKYPSATTGTDGVSWTTPYQVSPSLTYYDASPRVNKTDSDLDGLTNQDELVITRTCPCNNDTDGDGAIDGLEVSLGTDPLAVDTDGDGASDGAEISIGTDPLNASDFPILGMTPVTFLIVVGCAVVAIAVVAIILRSRRGKARKSSKASTKQEKSKKTK